MIAFDAATLTLAVLLYCVIIIDVNGLECYNCGAYLPTTEPDTGCSPTDFRTCSADRNETYCLISVANVQNNAVMNEFDRSCKGPQELYRTNIGCADDAEMAGFKNLSNFDDHDNINYTQYCICNTNLCNVNFQNAALNLPNDSSTTTPTTPTTTTDGDGSSSSSLELAGVLLFISNIIIVNRF